MKRRLSKEEYLELGRKIRELKDFYWQVFRMTTGHFPKNSKTIKSLLALDRALTTFYYEVETEFLHDYPEAEVTEYGR